MNCKLIKEVVHECSQNIQTAAKLFPDKTAILFEGKQIKYSELNAMANRLANAMMANGIQKGDRVALYLPNIPEFAICYYATGKILKRVLRDQVTEQED